LTIIDFNKLNLREANETRAAAKTIPRAWKVVFDCGHQNIISDEEMHNPIQRARFGSDHLYICDKCVNGVRSGTGDHGFFTKTHLHPIIMATPLFGSQLAQLQP
jgi:hypothetical protein